MCATLAAEVPELICPMNSSISLGLLPAAAMRVGVEIRVGGKLMDSCQSHNNLIFRPLVAKMTFLPILQAAMTPRDDFDPLAPQREAAFFYGLFLRGHSLDALRQDIDIPRPVAEKWIRARDFKGEFLHELNRVYQYRKRVLAIFEGLVSSEPGQFEIQ
jgi:hypothetical protein